MSENIVFPCPACGTKYSVSPHHAGKKTTCKKCGAPVTVPSPQVANPTIVGGTRTIRRADIDPGASAREESVSESGPAPEVDMTGGASVLRKDETVIGAPPVAGVSRRGTRAGTRPAPAGARPAPGGRPMPPGMGAPSKKNNMPLMLGIGGGAVGLVLIVVLIVVFSGGPSQNPGGGGGDDGAQNNPQTAQEDKDKRLVEDMRRAFNNVDALDLSQVRFYYEQARDRRDNPEFRSLQDSFGNALVRKADAGASPDDLADIGLMLHDDKHPSAELLLEKAWVALDKAGKAVREVREEGTDRRTHIPNAKFKDIVTRLGWQPYTYPEAMDLCVEYDVEGASVYTAYYNFDVPQVHRNVKLFPREIVDKLKSLEATPLAEWEDLVARDKHDGFALQARKAWLRFRNTQRAGRFDRLKGVRSFHPKAMGRENETIDQIWTYTYWRPFMVYVEKGIGQTELDAAFVESLESKAALLRQLHEWFNTNFITKFNLQRVKPQYNAEQAAREGWPIEIIVLKDKATFEKFVEDSRGRPMPGARALYSPLDERVMTYDDTASMDPDTQWFNESVLIHECFHQLSDHYAANPMFTIEQIQERPRYTSVLIQEGLTDSVSGFIREGDGRNAKYQVFELNHLRLDEFKSHYKMLGDRVLFRIRDTIKCRHYGQCEAVARDRAIELGLNPLLAMQNALGLYYPTVCMISYFFQNYKENGRYVYRDKWWEFIELDYTGTLQLTSYADNRGIGKFKEMFGIKTDQDWDDIEKKFLDYTMALTPENVGKSGGEAIKTDQDTVAPGFRPSPYDRSVAPGGASQPALPAREEEDALAG
jgi:hypothetical protein